MNDKKVVFRLPDKSPDNMPWRTVETMSFFCICSPAWNNYNIHFKNISFENFGQGGAEGPLIDQASPENNCEVPWPLYPGGCLTMSTFNSCIFEDCNFQTQFLTTDIIGCWQLTSVRLHNCTFTDKSLCDGISAKDLLDLQKKYVNLLDSSELCVTPGEHFNCADNKIKISSAILWGAAYDDLKGINPATYWPKDPSSNELIKYSSCLATTGKNPIKRMEDTEPGQGQLSKKNIQNIINNWKMIPKDTETMFYKQIVNSNTRISSCDVAKE